MPGHLGLTPLAAVSNVQDITPALLEVMYGVYHVLA